MANGQGGLNGIEAISGVQPASTSAVEKVTLLNTDYDYTKVSKFGNQTQFLGLTAQHTTVNFNSGYLDAQFGDKNSVGANPFLSDDAARQKYMQGGAGLKMFEWA